MQRNSFTIPGPAAGARDAAKARRGWLAMGTGEPGEWLDLLKAAAPCLGVVAPFGAVLR